MGKCCVCHCGHSINANVHSLSLKRAREGEMEREQILRALTNLKWWLSRLPTLLLVQGTSAVSLYPVHLSHIFFHSSEAMFTLLSLSYYFKWAKSFSNSVSIFSRNLSVPIILGNFMVSVDNQSNQPGRNQICNEEPSTLPLTHDFW